jgi:hypothetical protein
MSDEKNHQRLYLGIDLSVPQLKGVVIDEQLNIIAEEAISFNDKSLFVYHIQPDGFVIDETDNHFMKTPVLMFLEALGKKKYFKFLIQS